MSKKKSPPLMGKLMRILDSCEVMEPSGDDAILFHLIDGSIIRMTLTDEVKGAGETRH